MKYSGVYTALVTPFDKSGAIDFKALRDLVDFQIENGISGLVPMGTTGESPTLDPKEHIDVIQAVYDQAKGRVPIIAGAGSNSTSEAIELSKHAKEIGCAATLQVGPYYNKPSAEGFYLHFKAIAEAVDIPMIIYNIAGRTAKNIENDTMLRIAKLKNVAGVKEASGSLPQMMDIIAAKPEGFDVLSGDDNLVLPLISVGGTGVISVASNLFPKQMSEFVKLALAGDWIKAKEWHYKLLPFFKSLFIETNPIPIKYAMSVKGIIRETYRLPMCPMDDTKKQAMKKVLDSLAF